jgi:L-methionine (R)-S-oxide reductase
MPIVIDNALSQIRTIAAGIDDRAARAKRVAERIQVIGAYRWVGVYDVSSELVSLIAWSGPGAPAHPTFAASEGITGAAIARKQTVIVDDVRSDPRYLKAFGSTVSEIIVPVLAPGGGPVIGTIDVESDQAGAFSARDQQVIEQCAEAALPLWLLR